MRYFIDTDGVVKARGRDVADRGLPPHTLDDVSDPDVVAWVDHPEALIQDTGDGPYHQFIEGAPVLIARLTEHERDKMAIIHDFRPWSKMRPSYKEIDYKSKGLKVRLQPSLTLRRGEVVETIYYGDEDLTIPVVRETSVYAYNPIDSLHDYRILTAEWYDREGQIIPGSAKVMRKPYKGIARFKASKRRRENVYYYLQDEILEMLVAAGGGDIETGRVFLFGIKDLFATWIETAVDAPLTAAIANSPDTWLDIVVDRPEPGDTIRDFALYELR